MEFKRLHLSNVYESGKAIGASLGKVCGRYLLAAFCQGIGRVGRRCRYIRSTSMTGCGISDQGAPRNKCRIPPCAFTVPVPQTHLLGRMPMEYEQMVAPPSTGPLKASLEFVAAIALGRLDRERACEPLTSPRKALATPAVCRPAVGFQHVPTADTGRCQNRLA
jgi:hypothetical protein